MEFEYNNLDDEWINEFDNNDKLYQEFYKDDIYYINLRFIYINKENAIDKIKHESFLLRHPNKISREENLELIVKNSIDNQRRYTLLSILRYNINLEPNDVKNYLKNGDKLEYLSVIKNIDDIVFDKSINMFHDLNDLIYIFYEKSDVVKKLDANSTKKVYLRSLNTFKKTIRKRYKE